MAVLTIIRWMYASLHKNTNWYLLSAWVGLKGMCDKQVHVHASRCPYGIHPPSAYFQSVSVNGTCSPAHVFTL